MSRAIVVDDSLTVRMDLSEALSAAGFEVTPCASLAEARVALRAPDPGVVILDVMLPDGDGIELLQEIRAGSTGAAADTRVLLLSTEAEVRDRVRGMANGADDYLGKPYDILRVVQLARSFSVAAPEEASREQSASLVLLIDDSPTFLERMRELLEQQGHSVLTAPSGEEGLRAAATCRPALMIVDGALPGIDGVTVIRRVRLDAALRHVPCILLTASDDCVDEVSALESGADAFLRKEAEPDVVLGKVAALLARSSGRGPTVTSTLQPKRILAVDDSLTYLEMLADLLRADGHEVVLARSGEEALELLAHQSVDCVLLDLVMPGLTGDETCARMKASARLRDIPVIMLTAHEDRAAMLGSIKAGADDYIPKSSDFEVLRARLGAQLRRRQIEEETRLIREDALRWELAALEARAAQEVAEVRARFADELDRKNRELEAFGYSVSHDLRAPLRAIAGFSQALSEDFEGTLPPKAEGYVRHIRAGAQRMGALVDDLLALSRVTRAELIRGRGDLSSIAGRVVSELRRGAPERFVAVEIEAGLEARVDPGLFQIALENLLGNAWKFTAGIADARIEVGRTGGASEAVYSVRDNGAGFDSRYAHKLFRPFQRLHHDSEYAGTGIGLATVHRIIDRHGGRIWAESTPGEGATFFFTLGQDSHIGVA